MLKYKTRRHLFPQAKSAKMKNKEKSSKEFIEYVNCLFNKIRSENPDYKDIRLRKGDIKQLIEELIPLRDFIGEIEKDSGPFLITYHGKDSTWDATLRVENTNQIVGVQVTLAVEGNEYLRRQALVDGFPVFIGEIIKNKKTGEITSIPRVFTTHERIQENAQIIELAINRKKQFCYGSNCILLISVEEYGLILDDEWEAVKLLVNRNNLPFESVWLRRLNGQCEKI
jgi:hypothetical protein